MAEQRARDNEKKYLNFVELFKKANSTLDKKKQYEKAQELWKSVKNDSVLYETKLLELKAKAAKSSSKLMSFWQTTLSPPPSKKKKSRAQSPAGHQNHQSEIHWER